MQHAAAPAAGLPCAARLRRRWARRCSPRAAAASVPYERLSEGAMLAVTGGVSEAQRLCCSEARAPTAAVARLRLSWRAWRRAARALRA